MLLIDRTNKFEENIAKPINKSTFRDIVRLFKYAFSSSFSMCLLFLSLSILVCVLSPLLAYLWKKYLSLIIGYTNNEPLIKIVGLLACYYCIHFVFSILKRATSSQGNTAERLDAIQTNNFRRFLSSNIYSEITKKNAEYLEIPKINDIIERTIKFIGSPYSYDNLTLNIMVPVFQLVASIIGIIAIAVSLYIFSPWLCVILIIAPMPLAFSHAKIGEKLFAFSKENTQLERQVKYYRKLVEVDAVKELKSYDALKFIYDKWERATDILMKKNANINTTNFFIYVVNTVLINIASIAATIYAIILLTRGYIGVAELGGVFALITALLDQASSIYVSMGTLVAKKLDSAQFFELIDIPANENEDKDAVLGSINNICMDSISYRYPETRRYVLSDITLHISQNEKIAIVGENGAGKSTLAKILSGVLTPSIGDIYVNDISIEQYSCKEVYKNLTVLDQEPAILNSLTILENVKLGNIERCLNNAKAYDALSMAGYTADAVQVLGKGIGGINVSGGELQKIAIAKSFYRDKDFIILDEPTGNLDPIRENKIFETYLQLSKNKTIIYITHRISMASLADRIVVLKDGEIAQIGSHGELIDIGGEYRRLYDEQARWYKRCN